MATRGSWDGLVNVQPAAPRRRLSRRVRHALVWALMVAWLPLALVLVGLTALGLWIEPELEREIDDDLR